jgi:RNA polymerase sigma-70 factor, ECF subfamily
MAQGLSGPAGQLKQDATTTVNARVTALDTPGLHHDSDADLLAAAIRRDAAAFGRLVSRYHGLVYRIVWRTTKGSSDSEDIAQEAFLKLWNNPAQLRDPAALKGWLIRVANNLAMDWFRRGHGTDSAELPDVADGREDAEDGLHRSWAARRIDHAVASLPERQRLALTLFHFEHLTQAEAADTMELNVNAFESLLARARRALKDNLATDRQDLLATLAKEG